MFSFVLVFSYKLGTADCKGSVRPTQNNVDFYERKLHIKQLLMTEKQIRREKMTLD